MKDFNTDDDNIPVTSPKVQAPDAIIDQDDLWVMMEDDTQEMVEGMAAICNLPTAQLCQDWPGRHGEEAGIGHQQGGGDGEVRC